MKNAIKNFQPALNKKNVASAIGKQSRYDVRTMLKTHNVHSVNGVNDSETNAHPLLMRLC